MLETYMPCVASLAELRTEDDYGNAFPIFRGLDLQLAQLMCRLADADSAQLALAVALASNGAGRGDLCLELSDPWHGLDDEAVSILREHTTVADSETWREALLHHTAVVFDAGNGDACLAPLVLDGDRFYLRRYWDYEREAAEKFIELATADATLPDPSWGPLLDRLFPRDPTMQPGEADLQKLAAYTALARRLCIVSGGPGTGKTTTVARLLAARIEHHGASSPQKIGLAAPTGKAAARLAESMTGAIEKLNCPDEIREALPREAKTIHRLLGWTPNGFRFHEDNPLALDLLVLDEVSMIDLPLMVRVLRALPAGASLVLLGDKDQLASVEAGAVMAELCASGELAAFSAGHLDGFRTLDSNTNGLEVATEPAAPLTDSLVQLTRSYRFRGEGGIGAFAAAVRYCDAERAMQLAESSRTELDRDDAELNWIGLPAPGQLENMLRPYVLKYCSACCTMTDPLEALASLNRFRILAPGRKGPYGVRNLNALVRKILEDEGAIPVGRTWYPGRPVMISVNDYALRLYNGDVGVALPNESGELRVFFPSADGGVRSLSPARLPEHETVFAMTVHKSQGSEFDSVLMLLPEQTKLLTRELLYTGVTRARSNITLCDNVMKAIKEAVNSSIKRKSVISALLR